MYIHYIYVYTHIYIQTYVYDFDGHVYAAAGDKLAVGQKSHRKGGLVGRKEEGADTVAMPTSSSPPTIRCRAISQKKTSLFVL